MTPTQEAALQALGFRFGINGPHAARTMMLDELRALFGCTAPQAGRAEYAKAIVADNTLGKPTRKARELTLRYLIALYGLDTANPIFRALRRLWPLSEAAQPMLALAVALARDGAALALVGRDAARLRETAAHVRASAAPGLPELLL